MVKIYIPDKGDIVLLNFNPQAGKEQSGYRPAIAISGREYNNKVGLAIFCPITSKIKGYPFEVKLTSSMKTKGVILADHIKNLDWKIRMAQFIEKAPPSVLSEAIEKFLCILKG